jgi:hypothetical protein
VACHPDDKPLPDGCLYVDDAIVVWPTDRLDEVTAIIAAVNSGEEPDLLIGEGGISVAEGASPTDLPPVITDLCPTSVVWFGAP